MSKKAPQAFPAKVVQMSPPGAIRLSDETVRRLHELQSASTGANMAANAALQVAQQAGIRFQEDINAAAAALGVALGPGWAFDVRRGMLIPPAPGSQEAGPPIAQPKEDAP